ncbi:MAG TPA: hypothetical protein VGR19_07850 [Allosphingosinicella sp.]|nr:hypothetical protein [Allosphingosinicella sp.]
MIGKIVGAAIGKKVAGRYGGGKGMLLGALAPMVARRAFGPLGLALAGGWAAKKYYDSRKLRPDYRADRRY